MLRKNVWEKETRHALSLVRPGSNHATKKYMGKGDKACLVSCSTRIKSCHEKMYGKRRQGMPCLLFDQDQIMPRKNVWEKETRHAL
ncbi:MAG: hypothetical protein WCP08_09820, partial [Prolixibacteraceae bacterium]